MADEIRKLTYSLDVAMNPAPIPPAPAPGPVVIQIGRDHPRGPRFLGPQPAREWS